MSAAQPGILVGLIGAGIQASRTPSMHEAEGTAQGLRYLYRLIDLEVLHLGAETLPELLTAAERLGFSGLNVTHPCKQSVIPLLNELSSDSQAIGAVNTIVLRDGKRIGHNTDWWGFAESFRRGFPAVQRDQVVQLGAGGAGAAVAHAALTLGVNCLCLHDIDPWRAKTLADRLTLRFGPSRVVTGQRLEDDMFGCGCPPCDAATDAVPSRARLCPRAAPPSLGRGNRLLPTGNGAVKDGRRPGVAGTLNGGGMAVFQAVGQPGRPPCRRR